MPGILIKNFPTKLHKELKKRAKENHRSMNQEALTLLQEALEERLTKLPPLRRGKFFLTNEWIDKAKREGRE
jgi:plasmid stability protein